MKIWIINEYNMLPEQGHLNRHFYIGKYLRRLGHKPIVFVGSHPHNTDMQLIEGKDKYRVYQKKPFPWVVIKTRNYESSRIIRVISMFQFYFNMLCTARHFKRPDVIIGSSAHPLAALLAIQLGRIYRCKSIVEVRDLWPESIVAYGILSKNNPIIKMMYVFEKYLYTHADGLIFTMENAWQYFIDRGLDKYVPREKVHCLNNGVDLEFYRKNLKDNPYEDKDLARDDVFNVVYTGSIRRVNNLGKLLDAAKLVKNPKVRFLIWGGGDEVESLIARCKREHIVNVVFKGFVSKQYIASITSQANLNIMHGEKSAIGKYGLSANKLFDYAAAEKPILTDFASGMNPAEVYNAGVAVSDTSPASIANAIDKMAELDSMTYNEYCNNALKLAQDYSHENLAKKLIEIINDV